MNWKIFFIRFFRNLVVGVIIGVVAMGLFGYLLSGKEGMINMAYWGLAIGLIGGFSSGIGLIFGARFWGDSKNIQMFPEWNWFVKNSNDNKKDD